MDRVTDPATIAEQLGVQHHFLPSLYLKEMRIDAGTVVGKHTHSFDHLSILAKGSVVVKTTPPDGRWLKRAYEAPAYIVIQAGVEHEIHAATDSVWYCTHVTDETDPTKIDDALIGARKD